MMTELERALRELESATAALSTLPVEDFAEAQAAMDRRAWAIRDLAALVQGAISGPEREDAVERLSQASAAGEKVEQRLTAMRSYVAMEWSHWARIYRALGASPISGARRVDCRG
jgi:hypothetical protein